ncbi:MAG: Hsp20/alpha crystallin family protein [Planctomycetes bacterium]|nr:Hsp20/alpha crystallin family protein [Planctomycetota bacterium]
MDTSANSNTVPSACSGGSCAPEDASKLQHAERADLEDRNSNGRVYVPAIDIIDNDKQTILVMDMPGVSESGIDLSLEKNILSIHAKPVESTFEGKDLVYSEYGIGDYRRSFHISEDVDKDAITACIKDGVLKVTLPKTTPVTKKITVDAK